MAANGSMTGSFSQHLIEPSCPFSPFNLLLSVVTLMDLLQFTFPCPGHSSFDGLLACCIRLGPICRLSFLLLAEADLSKGPHSVLAFAVSPLSNVLTGAQMPLADGRVEVSAQMTYHNTYMECYGLTAAPLSTLSRFELLDCCPVFMQKIRHESIPCPQS